MHKNFLLGATLAMATSGALGAAVGLIDSATQLPIADADARYSAASHAATHGSGGADAVSLDAAQITTGELPDARVADTITAGQLAADPVACGAGLFVNDIAADGTLTCALPAGGSGTTFDGGTYTEVTFGTNVTLVDDGDGTATVNVSSGTATLGDDDYGDIVVSSGGTVMTIDLGVVGVTKLASADFGDFTCNGTVCTLDTTYLVGSDIAAGAITPATGNLDLTGTNGQVLVVDLAGNVTAGTLTDAAFTRVLNPEAGTIESWWRNPMAFQGAIVEVWCESDATVNLDVQVDDGTPADVLGTDLVCTSAGASSTTIAGDGLIETDETLDIAITSVSGAPTWVSLQVIVEYQ